MPETKNIKLKYNVPILEHTVIHEEKDGKKRRILNIKGVAINETVTMNGHKFTAEELEPAAPSLKGRPLLKDHINSVDSIAGRVKDAKFDVNKINFEARVTDEVMQEKIESGDIDSVSVGANIKEVKFVPENPDDEESETVALLKGISFVELSLVAVGADPNANFAKAICCALDLDDDKKLMKSEDINNKKEELKLTDKIEDKKTVLEELQAKEIALQEKVKALEVQALEKKAKALEKQVTEEEAPAEEPKEEEEKKEEPAKEDTKKPVEDETEGDVDNGDEAKTEDSANSYLVEKNGNGVVEALSFNTENSNYGAFKRGV